VCKTMKRRKMRFSLQAQRNSPRTLAIPAKQIIAPSLRPHVIPAIGESAGCTFATADGDNQPIYSLTAAREALKVKRHERRGNKLPTPGRKPLFADYCETYFGKAKVQRKRPGTVDNERQAGARWRDFLGHVRIDRITTPGNFGLHRLLDQAAP
jgi:hypothetical protein